MCLIALRNVGLFKLVCAVEDSQIGTSAKSAEFVKGVSCTFFLVSHKLQKEVEELNDGRVEWWKSGMVEEWNGGRVEWW